MSWDIYQVVFEALSPIHIGYSQIGILKTSRYYITGRAIWGTITANITKHLFDNPSSEDYLNIGNCVKKNIKTTYFFPAVRTKLSDFTIQNDSMILHVMIPNYTDNYELNFGNLTKEEFEYLFIRSFISTALSEKSGSAEERSLHETEFIINKIKINNLVIPIYWAGYLLVIDNICNGVNISIDNLRSSMTYVSVGGEKNYGFGKMKLVSFKKSSESFLFNESGIRILDKTINLDINKNAIALAHVDINDIESHLIKGNIEPLIGLEWENKGNSKKGAGQKISNANMCFVPGSRFKETIKTVNFQIGDYGIWNQIELGYGLSK